MENETTEQTTEETTEETTAQRTDIVVEDADGVVDLNENASEADDDDAAKNKTDEAGNQTEENGEDDKPPTAEDKKEWADRANRQKRQRDDARADNVRLRAENERLRSEAPEKSQVNETENQKPDEDDFETKDEYDEALIDWKVDQKVAKLRDETAQTKNKDDAEKQTKNWTDLGDAYEKENPGANKLMEDVADEYGIEFSDNVSTAIVGSKVGGHKMLHELAKNPELAVKISELKDKPALREIQKLEAKLQSSKEETTETVDTTKEKVETESKTVTKKPKAPKPHETVGGGGSEVNTDINEAKTYEEFQELRNKKAG